MKYIIVFAAVIACAIAATLPNSDKDAVILRYDNDNIGVGPYNVAVEESNGKSQQETAELRSVNPEAQSIAVRGSYSYVGDDGVTYKVDYVADENGFQPHGAHIPQA